MHEKAANHAELRMALIFRADLDAMTRGKSEGQACHAGLEAGVLLAREDPDLADRYLADGQPKVVLETPDLASLRKAIDKARSRGVRVMAITDLGRTCFDGPTTTCALIGPMSKTDSKAVTRGTSMRDPRPERPEDVPAPPGAPGDTPHGRLVGLPDGELRRLAPEATHQHAKGGLYRRLGPIVDGATKGAMRRPDGTTLVAWLHVHPHAPQVFARGEDEDAKYRSISLAGGPVGE